MRTLIYYTTLLLLLLSVALPAHAVESDEVIIDGPKPATGVHYDGIDVSSYQKDIDWSTTAKDKNIQYVYVKATEGRDYVSRHYEMNIRNARKHGVKVGSYHFLRTGSSIRAQFENFKRTARKEDQDLIPLIDVEVRNGWTDQQVRDSLKAFADLVEDYYGCRPMIYTSVSFFNKILGRAFTDYPLFIARYAANPPVVNGAKWTLWQFSERGRIAGIDHHVDLSCFNKGCSLKDILYRPGKTRRSTHSVAEEVDPKDKPDHVSVGDNKTKKEAPKKSRRQIAEEKRQAEKDRKAKERAEKMAKDEAKKKAEADRKAREKQERLKQEEQKRQAKEKADKAKEKAQQEAKAARKAKAKQAREQREKEKAAAQQQKKSGTGTGTTKARSTLLQSTKGGLTQSQRNDSVRAAQQKGRKINKSSVDND